MKIIGIDPGTGTTGYGVINSKGPKTKSRDAPTFLDCGVIKTNLNKTVEQRLKELHLRLAKLIKEYKPEILAVETLYFSKNLKTAMPVSEAKGVVLLTAAEKKIKVRQLTPLEVKMGLCGYGRASKKQVQRMVKEILGLKEIPRPNDAADGLAIALCCAFKERGLPR